MYKDLCNVNILKLYVCNCYASTLICTFANCTTSSHLKLKIASAEQHTTMECVLLVILFTYLVFSKIVSVFTLYYCAPNIIYSLAIRAPIIH